MSALWMSTLTEAAMRTTALLGVAAIVALTMRQRAAATRHLVWALALGGALVLPLAEGGAAPRDGAGAAGDRRRAIGFCLGCEDGALGAQCGTVAVARLPPFAGPGPHAFAAAAGGNDRGAVPPYARNGGGRIPGGR